MARIQIRRGTRYVHHNDICCVIELLADQRYRIENLSTGEVSILRYTDLVAAWAEAHLRFEVLGANARRDPQVPLNTHYLESDLADLPAELQAKTWQRYELVLEVYRYLDLEPHQMPSRQQIQEFISSPSGVARGSSTPCARTIERYMQAFVESGGDIRNLIPQSRQQGGKGQSRLGADVERLLAATLEKYAVITERVSTLDQIVTEVFTAIADENRFREPSERLTPPSARTIRRRVQAAGEKRVLGREPSRRERKRTEEVHPGPRVRRILERVEIDHTTLDLFVVDERDGLPIGRPHITACIDKYSGMVPGWHIGFNQGGYESIMLCLRHAFLPKPDYRALYDTEHDYPVYGLFEKLCIDNGRDFKSADLRVALHELGIIREEMPKDTPWFKGSIERYFRTVNERLLKGKPGYTFGNVVALGDYNAQKDAVISLSAFLEIFHLFMVDIYPHTWHSGLEAIPIQRWQESAARFTPDLVDDVTDLERILLPSAERALQAIGIEWENNVYWGPDLVRLRTQHGKTKVRFKYNPDDLNRIYVRDSSQPTGWVEFRSTRPEYTEGLSLAKHHLIRQSLLAQKRGVDPFSLARAKVRIQQVIEREFLTTHKLRRRSRLKPLLAAKPAAASEEQPEIPEGKRRPRGRPAKADPTPPPEPTTPLDTTGWSSDYELPLTGEAQL